jgi:Zn-dependent protease
LRLFSVRGAPVGVHWSVIAVMVLATVSTAAPLELITGASPVTAHVAAAGLAVGFLASILAHELAHVAAAFCFGIPVRRVTLWALGGAAELDDEFPSPGAAFVVAVVGPLSSLLCAVVCGAVALMWWSVSELVSTTFMYLLVLNVVVAVFNALPGSPLDGGRIVMAAAWRLTGSRHRGELVAGYAGWVLGVAFSLYGVWRIVVVGPTAVFTLVVAAFIVGAATQEVRVARGHLATERAASGAR